MKSRKLYIIMTPCVTNMGGAQMYVRNKYIYMRNQGWDVEIITSQKGTVYISDLKKFNYIIPELGYYIFIFPKSKQNTIIHGILGKVIQKPYDKIIIESTCIGESTWAEVLAKKINAKHLFFDLQEQDYFSSKTIQEYLIFKHSRRELVGINAMSLYNFFLPFHPINKDKSYRLPAYCNNVEEDIPCPLLKKIDLTKYDYIIGCLSRLDKPFIIPAITDFISYVRKHKNKKYLLLLIGGAPEVSCNHIIRNMFKNIPNSDIFITGYIFPVPTKLLDICNAFFTSAGSCRVCMRSGIPTISYDANDYRPIGIMGRTTNNALIRADDEPQQNFSQLMDDILEKNIYKKEHQNYYPSNPDFSSHDEFVSLTCPQKEYYSFDNTKLSIKEKILSSSLWLIGADNYNKLGTWKQKLLTKIK